MSAATIAFARDVCARVADPLCGDGYLVALYGSVLVKGAGRDVDLLLVPWRPRAVPDDAIRTIVAVTGGVDTGLRYRGIMETLGVTILVPGAALDIQIREVRP